MTRFTGREAALPAPQIAGLLPARCPQRQAATLELPSGPTMHLPRWTASHPYRDTPRSRWEARQVAAARPTGQHSNSPYRQMLLAARGLR